MLRKTLNTTLTRVPYDHPYDPDENYALFQNDSYRSFSTAELQRRYKEEHRYAGNIVHLQSVLLFVLPDNVDPEHVEYEVNQEDHTLAVYNVDDQHERYNSAPLSPALLNSVNLVDTTILASCEAIRMDLWHAYMQKLGEGRYNVAKYRDKAYAVASAVVNLYFTSEDRLDPAKGIMKPFLERIGEPNLFQAQADAAILTLAQRSDEDRLCSAGRAVELVQSNPATGRTA